MQFIKHFFQRHKVTLMVIPSADKSIKQLKLNFGIAMIVLLGLIAINLSLLFSTLLSKAEAVYLSSENVELSESLLMTQDRINSLQNINQNRYEEIQKLKESLEGSSQFLETRLMEIEQAEAYLAQLIVLFNEETKSSIEAPTPVSRSFARAGYVYSEGNHETTEMDVSEEALVFTQIEDLIEIDEISSIFSEQTEAYQSLVEELESRLSYLDRRPDLYPAKGTLSSKFGYRSDPITRRTTMHNGIDISNRSGTSIYAAGAGVVTFARYSGSFGNLIIIDHGNGYETAYAHCRAFKVKLGESVGKGDLIATMGASGRTTGTHLHFEIRYNGNPINPLNILNTN